MSHPYMKGIYTAIYRVPDLAGAKAWYSQAFGVSPYFDEPFYVGFDVAGFELGLLPQMEDRRAGAGGVIAYWGVNDAHAAVEKLLAIGATSLDAVQDVGDGILIGSVRDPFGNALGIIQNSHFRR